MNCLKIKYDKIGAMLALASCTKPSAKPERNEVNYYYCTLCNSFHLTSQK